MKNNFFSRWWVFLVAIVFLVGIVQPWRLNNFSLVDDGQSALYAHKFSACISKFECSDIGDYLMERQFGRLRPFYWVLQMVTFAVFGNNATAQHIGRMMLIIFMIFGFVYWGNKLRIKNYGLDFGLIFFLSSFSLIENTVRLGPIEPWQLVILLSMFFVLTEFGLNWVAIIVWTFLLLTKETSIGFLPVIVCLEIFLHGMKNIKRLILMLLISIIIVGIIRVIPITGGAYSENYVFSLNLIWLDFVGYWNILRVSFGWMWWVFMIGSIGLFVKPKENVYRFIWLLTIVVGTAILLPWKYVLDRYILIPCFGISLLMASYINDFFNLKFVRQKTFVKILLVVSVLVLTIPNIAHNVVVGVNYVNWFRSFSIYDQSLVVNLVKLNKPVCLNFKDNLENCEVWYEIPIQINLMHHSRINVSQWDGKNQDCVIVSRSINEKNFEDRSLNRAEITKRVTINQFVVEDFDKEFLINPIKAITQIKVAKKFDGSWTILN